ncbi:flavoprotein [Psychrobacillus sp. L4]|uniref:flavoprotein n=1 Tax=Psychrobacillus sp. L4 TaxID=3236892 RepID=UPI0036F27812
MENSFRQFLHTYLEVWRTSSLIELKDLISKEYQAREITGGEIVDFGYEESIKGWEEGFNFVKDNRAQWDLNEISILSLNEDEAMAILSATLIVQGKNLETANLFFQTFKKSGDNDWKLVRSYIEAGISNIDRMQTN